MQSTSTTKYGAPPMVILVMLLGSLTVSDSAVAQPGTAVCGDGGYYWYDLLRTYRLAAECVQLNYEDWLGEVEPLRDDRGAVFNLDTETQVPVEEFVCPLESKTDDNALEWLGCPSEVAIYVVDEHPNLNVECNIFATDPFTLTTISSTVLATTGTSPNGQKLSWSSFAPAPNDFWGIHCRVPNQPAQGEPSGIVSYYMDELDIKNFVAD